MNLALMGTKNVLFQAVIIIFHLLIVFNISKINLQSKQLFQSSIKWNYFKTAALEENVFSHFPSLITMISATYRVKRYVLLQNN